MDDLEPWRLFLVAHSRALRAIEAELREAGAIPLVWYDVLLELRSTEQGRLRMQQLSDRVVLSRSRVSRLVDELERAGLVKREPDPDDGRASLACITDAGRTALRRAAPVYVAGIKHQFLDHVSDGEARSMVAAFQRVIAANSA